MEYNGRVYVYTTNDVIEYDSNGNVTENTYAQVNKINCISSDDMVNWTDHGAIPVAGTEESPNGRLVPGHPVQHTRPSMARKSFSSISVMAEMVSVC